MHLKKALYLQDNLIKVYQHKIYGEKMFNNFQIIEDLKLKPYICNMFILLKKKIKMNQ